MARILPCCFQFVQCAHRFFNGNDFRAESARRPVDLIQINPVGAQVLEGPFAGFNNLSSLEIAGPNFGGNDDLIALVAERLRQNPLAVALRRRLLPCQRS